MKKYDINHPLWEVMNNLHIIRSYLSDENSILKDLIVEHCFDLLNETIEQVETLYRKDIE